MHFSSKHCVGFIGKISKKPKKQNTFTVLFSVVSVGYRVVKPPALKNRVISAAQLQNLCKRERCIVNDFETKIAKTHIDIFGAILGNHQILQNN